jgi:next-to-BRCA1 protein 1
MMSPWFQRQHSAPDKPKAKFVKDESLPDRAVVLPSQTLVKTWKIQNTGTSEWPKGTKLIFFRGDRALATEEEFDVPVAKAGESVDVSAVIITPSLSHRALNGRHTAVFRLADEERTPFGPRLWCDVIVADVSKPKGDELKAEEKDFPVPSAPSAAPSTPSPSSPSAPAPSTPSTPSTPSSVPSAPVASSAGSSASGAVAAPKKWAMQLDVLSNMGFKNEELNICLLESNQGNVQKVCEFLINTAYS